MAEMTACALICCSDERADALGAVLAAAMRVFLVSGTSTRHWSDGRFMPIDQRKLPRTFTALFFHTGNNDPIRIPEGRVFKSEFAFSTSETPRTDRRKATPIARSFTHDACPVKPEHLEQIVAFAEGRREEPPDFCKRPPSLAAGAALAVLCQGYLAVHARKNDGTPDMDRDDPAYTVCSDALKCMGWDALCGADSPARELLRDDLSSFLPDVKKPSWWAKVFDGRKPQLEQLRKQSGGADLTPADDLLEAVWDGNVPRPDSPENALSPIVVAKAYSALARAFSEVG